MDKSRLVFQIAKLAAGSYVFIASLVALLLLVCVKAFHRLTYRLFIYVLISSMVLSLAISFDAITVGLMEQGGEQNSTSAVCVISGVLIQYATWLDLLAITWSVAWLIRITGKYRQRDDAEEGKTEENKKKLKVAEWVGLVIVLLVPLLAVVVPLGLSLYGNEGAWCRITILDERNTTMEGSDASTEYVLETYRDFNGVIVGLILHHIPIVVLMFTNITLVVFAMVKISTQLCSNESDLRESFTNVLKDGIVFGVLIVIIFLIYDVWFGGYVYFLITLEDNRTLWFIEVAAFAVRGAAIFCIILNPSTCLRIKKANQTTNKTSQSSPTHMTRHDDGITVEGSFTLQQPERDSPNTVPHIRALPTLSHSQTAN